MPWLVRKQQFADGRIVTGEDLVAAVRSTVGAMNRGVDRENIQQATLTDNRVKRGAASRLLGYGEVVNTYSQTFTERPIVAEDAAGDPWVLEFTSKDEWIYVFGCVTCQRGAILVLDGNPVAGHVAPSVQFDVHTYRLGATVPVAAGSHTLQLLVRPGTVEHRVMGARGARR